MLHINLVNRGLEPAKIETKLRATKTDDYLWLLKTDFSNGLSDGSGRFIGFREYDVSFCLDCLSWSD